MAAPSYTYTLTNGTTADASQVMQNFNDVLNGITDGTKDLSINALTAAGTATLNGNVNVGNASGDDLTITASLASTIPIKTTNTYDIGSATKGLAGVYLGTSSTQTARIVSTGTLASSRTYTLLDAGANANFVLSEGAATINGLKTFGTGFQLPTSGGTPSTLSFYQAYSDSVSITPAVVSGSGSLSSTSWTTILTRVGNLVTLYVRMGFTTSGGSTINQVKGAAAIPSWALPAESINVCLTFDNSVPALLFMVTNKTSGDVNFSYRSPTTLGAANFAASTAYGLTGTASWTI